MRFPLRFKDKRSEEESGQLTAGISGGHACHSFSWTLGAPAVPPPPLFPFLHVLSSQVPEARPRVSAESPLSTSFSQEVRTPRSAFSESRVLLSSVLAKRGSELGGAVPDSSLPN